MRPRRGETIFGGEQPPPPVPKGTSTSGRVTYRCDLEIIMSSRLHAFGRAPCYHMSRGWIDLHMHASVTTFLASNASANFARLHTHDKSMFA